MSDLDERVVQWLTNENFSSFPRKMRPDRRTVSRILAKEPAIRRVLDWLTKNYKSTETLKVDHAHL